MTRRVTGPSRTGAMPASCQAVLTRRGSPSWKTRFVSCGVRTRSFTRRVRICTGGARPPLTDVDAFIEDHRGEHGVETPDLCRPSRGRDPGCPEFAPRPQTPTASARAREVTPYHLGLFGFKIGLSEPSDFLHRRADYQLRLRSGDDDRILSHAFLGQE